MYLISGNITGNVTGNLLVITGNGNIGNITSNFRTLPKRHRWFEALVRVNAGGIYLKFYGTVSLCYNSWENKYSINPNYNLTGCSLNQCTQ